MHPVYDVASRKRASKRLREAIIVINIILPILLMARKRINTRGHTKEKPHMINSYFFFLPRVETRGIIEARDSETVTETKSM